MALMAATLALPLTPKRLFYPSRRKLQKVVCKTTDLSRFSKNMSTTTRPTYQVDMADKEGFTEKNYIYRQCRATSAATVYGRTTTVSWVLRWMKSRRRPEKDDDSVINSLEHYFPAELPNLISSSAT
ncbi:hypothetical protein ACLK17_19315 [Escherichia coli]